MSHKPMGIASGKRAADAELGRVAAELAASNAALQAVNRLYSLLSRVNHTINRARDMQDLLEGICRTAVEDGGFRLAFFGQVEDSGAVRAAAKCGPATDYLDTVRIRADESAEGNGPAGRALRTGELVICNDIHGTGSMEPWWEEARHFGLHAVAAIPVRLAGSVFGAFVIYSGEPGFFSRDEVQLLRRISDDVGFGLEKIESDRQRDLAARTLQETIDRLSRSNAELENFAYVASHDLQEPLRMVVSYLQLLKKRLGATLDADCEEFLGYAVEGGQRMKRLVDDLLKYSQLNTETKALAPERADALVDQAILNLSDVIEESGAVVTRDSLPEILADAGQMIQVFQNLVGNSIKFRGPEPPRIHVSVRPNGEQWVFSVADNGIGIEPRYRERIFEIFHRLHPQSAYAGSGIGLTVSKKIVARHGGRIWLEDREGPGAKFSFSIPAMS